MQLIRLIRVFREIPNCVLIVERREGGRKNSLFANVDFIETTVPCLLAYGHFGGLLVISTAVACRFAA
jgi:hypothetical protein